jgi:hypothetical protein
MSYQVMVKLAWGSRLYGCPRSVPKGHYHLTKALVVCSILRTLDKVRRIFKFGHSCMLDGESLRSKPNVP